MSFAAPQQQKKIQTLQMKKFKQCDRCGEPRIIWKNVTGTEGRMKLCQTCYNIWSAQNSDNSNTKSATKKPIRSRSPKRKKKEAEYSKKRKQFLTEHPYCEIPVPGICTHHATDVHHVDGRVEDNLTDEDGFKAGCRACHQWVHANPADARELGYLI